MTTTLSDSAVRRAAFAMLRSLGATEIVVRTAAPTVSDDRGLGLQQFEISEARLANSVVRQTSDKPLRLEIVVSATEVEAKLGVSPEDASEALRSLAGICWREHLMRITGVATEMFAGRPYLYRISAEA